MQRFAQNRIFDVYALPICQLRASLECFRTEANHRKRGAQLVGDVGDQSGAKFHRLRFSSQAAQGEVCADGGERERDEAQSEADQTRVLPA